MIIFSIILLSYIVSGVFYSRYAYALQQFNNANAGEMEIKARVQEIKNKRAALNHDVCNLRYAALASQGCDCGKSYKWNSYNKQINDLNSSLIGVENTSVWNFAALWPLHITSSFMKGGTVKKANPALIARLEQEIGINND